NDGNIPTVPQENLMGNIDNLRPAPKIFKETCRIDWAQPAENVYNFIRGLSPYPAAWTELTSADSSLQSLKIFQTEKIIENHALTPGSIVTDGKTFLQVAVADGFINILSLQLSGKKRMNTRDFLNGVKVGGDWEMQ
ncbi:MAG: methionyl-tRNA formyltransferase, partial [Tannerella sp.]|nr:methionyl-tRNA formyltransferase [Tannerella sp.]